jgi:hypothetical protein
MIHFHSATSLNFSKFDSPSFDSPSPKQG